MQNYFKVQTYVPQSHLQTLKEALNDVITPVFAGYDFVFTHYPVTGQWRPLAGAKPYQGQIGQIESAIEIKLEFTILANDLQSVFATIQKHHPYEKPVIEAFAVTLASHP